MQSFCIFVWKSKYKKKHMSTLREQRQVLIAKYIRSKDIPDQKSLRALLQHNGLEAAQSTISRDLEEMKVTKVRGARGKSFYRLPEDSPINQPKSVRISPTRGFSELVYAEPYIVVKTRAGYANSLAADIDAMGHPAILATISGYDSILIIPTRNASYREVKEALGMIIPELKE